MNTLKGLLGAINSLISRLNRTPVKRIIIYVIVIYPLFFGFYYKDEILMALSNDDKREVIIKYLDRANKRCFDLREKWRAESVMLYIYQPEGIQKTEKERGQLKDHLGLKINSDLIFNSLRDIRISWALLVVCISVHIFLTSQSYPEPL